VNTTLRTILAMIALLLLPAGSRGADWHSYGNARFNYWIDIPPGFPRIAEAENGDGGSSEASVGHAKLSVWGSYLSEGDFRQETKWRADQDRADGWSVTLERGGPGWAVWSGAKAGRIFYQRAIPGCNGAAAYFRLEYDKESAAAFDPVIVRLGKSLRSGKC
jgi:hypothetical protein